MSPYLLMHMTAEQKLKDAYPKMLRNALLMALAVHFVGFLVTPELNIRPYKLREKQVVEAIAIPDQFEIPPPPQEEVKEQIVTEIAPSDDAAAEETIASTELNVDAPPEPPPALTRTEFFMSYDEPPVVTRHVQPVYPPMARDAEVEGVVVVQLDIDEFGNVVNARIVQSVPMLDQAALDAVRQWKFKPAKQRDEPVPVRYAVPIRFTLTG
ncbi:TonB family protein [bacterium]|nr:TonB family protein [bacterium]